MMDFYGKRRIFYVVSLAIMIVGAIIIAINGGFVLDIQFQGGAIIEICVPNDDYDLNSIQNVLTEKTGKVINAQKSFSNYNAEEDNPNAFNEIYNLDIRIETEELLTDSEIDSVKNYIVSKYGNIEITQKDYSETEAPYVARFNARIPESFISEQDAFNSEVATVENDLKSSLNKRVSTDFSYIFVPEDPEIRKDILNIKIPTDSEIADAEIDEVKKIVSEELDIVIAEDSTTGDFNVSSISADVGKETLRNSFLAVVVASVLILIYVAFRFRTISGFSAGFSAILALAHDAIMMILVYGIMGYPINENFIAAVLTIIGYSINDTIVIFDRIRENTARHKDLPPWKLANLSINQTLTRSINTAFCVLISLVVLYIAAKINQLTSMELFAFPLIIGMISGCYSTIFISAPFWAAWQQRKQGLPVNVSEKDEVVVE